MDQLDFSERGARAILAIWLPNWPVQRLLRAMPRQERGRPLVLFGRRRNRLAVTACSRSAAQAGVRVQAALADARALWRADQAEARFVQQDEAQDLASLRKLALYCQKYSPIAALEEAEAPETLFLDVSGGLHLFGGAEGLVAQVARDLRGLELAARVALAGTLGLAWAAAHHLAPRRPARTALVLPHASRQALLALPLAALRLPPETVRRLEAFDLRTVRQLAELPRGAVALRFGREPLLRLDQALGEVPEVPQAERVVEPVEEVWEDEEPLTQPQQLDAVSARLVYRTLERLAPQQLGVRQLRWALREERRQTHAFTVGLLKPCVTFAHLMELVRLQFEGLRLASPLTRVAVHALVEPLEFSQGEWFEATPDSQRQALAQLLERLSSRLGPDRVLRASLQPDAQPEFSCAYVPWLQAEASSASSAPSAQPLPMPPPATLTRPTLLRPAPEPIEVQVDDARPVHLAWGGRRHALARAWGPERIETGWWRRAPIRRDYYRVESTHGDRFWIFLDLDQHAWFLHGIFC